MAMIYRNESTGTTNWNRDAGRVIKTDGCIFFLCMSGTAAVSANMQKTAFRRSELLVLTSDIFFSVDDVSDDFSARYLSLPETMLETAYYRIACATVWNHLHHSPILKLSPEQFKLVAGWMDQAAWILDNITGGERQSMLNNSTYNLFVAIDAALAKYAVGSHPGRKDRAWDIITRFWSLVAKHSFRIRNVAFYAEALHITPDHLYKVCRRTYGQSPKSLIDQQLTVEIKCYLADTQLSVTEIADRLHFEDASYMCRFFRRMTGCSPLEFRNGSETKPQTAVKDAPRTKDGTAMPSLHVREL